MNKKEINELIKQSEIDCKSIFDQIDDIAYKNQYKVLNAFRNHSVGPRHFAQTTGYGYDDVARDTLYRLFAEIIGAESAICSPLIMSGTHALTLALFGLLRPNDTLLSITGEPYDTLHDVINGENIGSLKDFGVKYKEFDYRKTTTEETEKLLKDIQPKVVFFQRSRGYTDNKALSVEITHIFISLYSCSKNLLYVHQYLLPL